MMTSRTEYRLLHRQDNADRRLASIGRELGLLSETQYGRVLEKGRAVELEVRRLEHTGTPPSPELDRDVYKRQVLPYIPGRLEEGYGLNREAIASLARQGVTRCV